MILSKSPTIFQIAQPPGIIFDFDGVLVDSLKAHLLAWEQATRQIFNSPIKDIDSLAHRSTSAIAGIISQSFGQKKLSSQLALLKTKLLKELVYEVELFPNVKEFLNRCVSSGIPIAIGSNSPRNFIETVCRNQSLPIDTIFGAEDISKPKPHPMIFQKCAKSIGVQESLWPKILVFEDSLHGIKAAKSAKMSPIGICTLHSPHDLIKQGAIAAITGFDQVSLLTS